MLHNRMYNIPFASDVKDCQQNDGKTYRLIGYLKNMIGHVRNVTIFILFKSQNQVLDDVEPNNREKFIDLFKTIP